MNSPRLFLRPPEGENGFTLLELMTVMVLVAVLAALLFPVIEAARKRPEGIRCMANMRSLHTCLSSYVADRGTWPQMPQEVAKKNGLFAAWWLNELHDFGGGDIKVWQCPGVMREIADGTVDEKKTPFLHYTPTSFEAGRLAPFQWSTQPWLAEMYNHGDGNFFIFPDGSIRTFNDIYEQYSKKP